MEMALSIGTLSDTCNSQAEFQTTMHILVDVVKGQGVTAISLKSLILLNHAAMRPDVAQELQSSTEFVEKVIYTTYMVKLLLGVCVIEIRTST